MATRARGANFTLLGAFETVENTPPDGSGGGVYTSFPARSFTLDRRRETDYVPILNASGGSADDGDPFYNLPTYEGSLVVPLDLRYAGHWLKAVLSAPTTSGVGPYDHLFKSGSALPTLSLEKGHPDLTTPKYVMNTGVRAGGLNLSVSPNGLVEMTIPLFGRATASAASSEDASPLTEVYSGFFMSDATVKIGGSAAANLVRFDMAFSNNVEALQFIGDNAADEQNRSLTGSATVRWGVDTAWDTPAAAGTPVALLVEFQKSASEKIVFDMPRVFLPEVPKEVNGPGGIEVTYNFQASGADAVKNLLEVTLTNDVTGY